MVSSPISKNRGIATSLLHRPEHRQLGQLKGEVAQKGVLGRTPVTFLAYFTVVYHFSL